MEATIMENQMEKKMENEMETGIINIGVMYSSYKDLGLRLAFVMTSEGIILQALKSNPQPYTRNPLLTFDRVAHSRSIHSTSS